MTPGRASSATVTVEVEASCTACGACLWTCPTHALVPAPRRPVAVDARCTGCLECVEICPRDAIRVRTTATFDALAAGPR